MVPSTADLPSAMVERSNWLCWRAESRDGKSTKVPVSPTTGNVASATDSDTWTSFDRARSGLEAFSATGLGFAFDADGPFVGVDLDDCRDSETGELAEWATDIVTTLDSYTEVSPSGEGVHILVRGSLPPGRNRRGDVECYAENRFFTVTGAHVPGTPETIQNRTEALTEVYGDYLATVEDSGGSDDEQAGNHSSGEGHSASNGRADFDTSPAAAALSNSELLSRAQNAANGAKFNRLWRGDTSGYESHSEADMALCALLAFWTGGDRARVDDLFRQSGLLRPKWDEVHYADGRTYGEVTVRRAVDGTDEFYEPQGTSGDAPVRDGPADGIRVDASSEGRYDGERPRAIESGLTHRLTSQAGEDASSSSQHLPSRVATGVDDGDESTEESVSTCPGDAVEYGETLEGSEDGDVDGEVKRLRSEVAQLSRDLRTRETELARLKQTLAQYESELDSERATATSTDRGILTAFYESLRDAFTP